MKLPDFSRQLAVLSRFRYGKLVRPERDWFVLLLATLALILLSGAWNAWMFTYGTKVVPQVEDSSSITGPSENTLKEANALFERRAAEEGRYRSEYRFVDPRLSGS